MNMQPAGPQSRASFTELVDLACETVGTRVLEANDDFFAPKENLILAAAPVFIPDKYTEFGKWMDGWESRRKRDLSAGAHDWCVLQLGQPSIIHGANVDTAFFVGNYPEYCSLEGATAATGPWEEVLTKSRLQGGMANYFPIASRKPYTHIRLKIFPDGGVARLRLHGEVAPDWSKLKSSGKPLDLAALENGGVVVSCNDSFFGPKDNLILPGRARTMGEGWETRRKRGAGPDGHDWIIIRLGAPGRVAKIEVDTNHFKGNFPDTCAIEACHVPGPALLPCDFRDRSDIAWTELLPRVKLKAHHQHVFEKELRVVPTTSYVRLKIFPDGGISRLRVWGTP